MYNMLQYYDQGRTPLRSGAYPFTIRGVPGGGGGQLCVALGGGGGVSGCGKWKLGGKIMWKVEIEN